MKRLFWSVLLLAILCAVPVLAQVAETDCNNSIDDDADGDIDCADSDCAPWVPCTSKIKIVIGVDNSISSDLVMLCNWIQDRGRYSANGWANLTTCPQAVFGAGIRVWADQASRETAVAFGRTQEGVKYDELYDPVDAGVELHDPPSIVCGDGYMDTTEQCDDGNVVDGDGCQANCRLPICGDRIVDAGEECDDGGTFNGDGCASDCTWEMAVCGDGILQNGEECDDGNLVPGDGCSAACTTE